MPTECSGNRCVERLPLGGPVAAARCPRSRRDDVVFVVVVVAAFLHGALVDGVVLYELVNDPVPWQIVTYASRVPAVTRIDGDVSRGRLLELPWFGLLGLHRDDGVVVDDTAGVGFLHDVADAGRLGVAHRLARSDGLRPSITTPMRSSTSRTTSNGIVLVFCPQYMYSTVSPTAARDTLGVTLNVNVTSGGGSGPWQAAAVISSLSSITTPPPASIVTVLVTC